MGRPRNARVSSRRTVLHASVGTLITALAGCVARGDDEDEDVERLDGDPGDGPPPEHVEIADHDLQRAHMRATCTFEAGPGDRENKVQRNVVVGTVENASATPLERVVVEATVYDESETKLGTYTDLADGLDSMAVWEFEIMVFEDADDVEAYDVEIETLEW